MNVSLSVRMSLLKCYWKGFREIWYRYFIKICRENQMWLKCEDNEDVTTCVLLTAIRNIVYRDNSAKGIHCCFTWNPICTSLSQVLSTCTVHLNLLVRSILILSSHLRLGLPSGPLPSGLPSKIMYAAACLIYIVYPYIHCK
jgi:hypothetical protein